MYKFSQIMQCCNKSMVTLDFKFRFIHTDGPHWNPSNSKGTVNLSFVKFDFPLCIYLVPIWKNCLEEEGKKSENRQC